MWTTVRRFIGEETGQDLIEYALLSALIGLCAVAAWVNIPPAIRAAYLAWDSDLQTLESCTPDPGGGGC